MNTLFKISWRNLYRNFRRTLIMAIVVAIGFVGTIFCLSFVQGYMRQTVENAIQAHTGHLQIHQLGFADNPVIKKRIQKPQTVERILSEHSTEIQAFTQRIKNQGMINSSESSAGALIIGIDPEKEAEITQIKKSLVEGQYLAPDDAHAVYLGKALAKKLKVHLNDKIVLMGQTLHQEIGGGAFRVKGLFQTSSPSFDKAMVFITLPAAQNLFEMKTAVSEFTIIARQPETLEVLQTEIKSGLNAQDYEVLTWKELLPALAQLIETSSGTVYIIVFILLIGICFSIINTLFVIVFERFREFGIMKALGTPPRHIFVLILFEALGMTSLGIALGGVLSTGIMSYFHIYGLNLSAYSKGIAIMNLGEIFYLSVTPAQIITSIVLTLLIVALAALYPAWVAARIQPIKALKFI
ncbi:hypothetical protein COW36_13220 [bacterium (Candidatus Blackallbacteria) CG17_big_fil_post_rev_8_21_14_2_50_48_46]|uniref:ABC transporter permease n=1 Tax=bacterium (Candidatus Blackallbacteria) CG17_big_fil_post_rev_8_21_14_2_50_48_46 TaxID=2014261 RepID=A0A2M7G4D4_9BACT|nr:MAG: hypothetical protein COW64_02050 [bacterium (Candidatus Blackallbacteria) CG18_big_fil_WC_8_21_14_2_50_49_26]PIW16720.1 MAG: hypothetical protein COW36_13220 [bacterium (Candidatus Blackallbacteria) CG17_big_fil_post_rev_8_21_14_2_50_48_46]PIW46226.1 MAG: hypothetical protein COW20_18470 [bacterium (Candidatus Blackallbacteria) CG13_big_fil_rev_8_21_14_2_50_49_14]